ncbi:MAG TPA: pseudouridine synthase [Rhodanobacteraceae bacterium]
MKLVRYLANLGYGSRRDVNALLAAGRVTTDDGQVLAGGESVAHAVIRIDGQPLDPPPGMVLMLNKPTGVTCSHDDAGPLVYGLLPPRFRQRRPLLSSVGRLDRDTSGLLLLTDDGALLHRIIAPRTHVAKVYEATLAAPLRGDEGEIFARGELLLRSESQPLAPAQLQVLGPRHVRLSVTEGRYHQVRRMFAAVDNHVETLQRVAIGGLTLDDLPQAQWRVLGAEEMNRIFDAVCGG